MKAIPVPRAISCATNGEREEAGETGRGEKRREKREGRKRRKKEKREETGEREAWLGTVIAVIQRAYTQRLHTPTNTS